MRRVQSTDPDLTLDQDVYHVQGHNISNNIPIPKEYGRFGEWGIMKIV